MLGLLVAFSLGSSTTQERKAKAESKKSSEDLSVQLEIHGELEDSVRGLLVRSEIDVLCFVDSAVGRKRKKSSIEEQASLLTDTRSSPGL